MRFEQVEKIFGFILPQDKCAKLQNDSKSTLLKKIADHDARNMYFFKKIHVVCNFLKIKKHTYFGKNYQNWYQKHCCDAVMPQRL